MTAGSSWLEWVGDVTKAGAPAGGGKGEMPEEVPAPNSAGADDVAVVGATGAPFAAPAEADSPRRRVKVASRRGRTVAGNGHDVDADDGGYVEQADDADQLDREADLDADANAGLDVDLDFDAGSPEAAASNVEDLVVASLGSTPALMAAALDTLADQVEQIDRLEVTAEQLTKQLEAVNEKLDLLGGGLVEVAGLVGAIADPTVVVAALHDDMTQLVNEMAGGRTLVELLDEVQGLSQGVAELRRGLAFLAKGGTVNVAAALDEKQLERVADLVVTRLQEVLEVVPDDMGE